MSWSVSASQLNLGMLNLSLGNEARVVCHARLTKEARATPRSLARVPVADGHTAPCHAAPDADRGSITSRTQIGSFPRRIWRSYRQQHSAGVKTQRRVPHSH